jgi:hypothetical protein
MTCLVKVVMPTLQGAVARTDVDLLLAILCLQKEVRAPLPHLCPEGFWLAGSSPFYSTLFIFFTIIDFFTLLA